MQGILGHLGSLFGRDARIPRLARRPSLKKLHAEPLECRRLLTASQIYFNDQWALVSDLGSPGLDVGDIVDNSIGWGGGIQATYGVDAFGVVKVGGVDTSVSGYDTVADAIAATPAGGATKVLSLILTPQPGPIEVDQEMLLEGRFTVASGDLTLDHPGAVLRVGTTAGITNATTLSNGDLNLNAGTASFGVNLDGSNNKIVVNGAVNLTGAKLEVVSGDYGATVGTQYILIDNDGADPVVGTFASLPENATFSIGEREARISYQGGTGNDVVLTVTNKFYSFASFVNDNWHHLGGGYVDNEYDVDPPTVWRRFEVPTMTGGVYSAAYDDLQEAIDATAERGSVTVLPGSYGPQNVVVDKKLTLAGGFELDGTLTVNDIAVKLLFGSEYGEISTTGLALSPSTTLVMKAGDGDADRITVDGGVDLADARLELSWVGEEQEDILLLDNQSLSPIVGTFRDLPEGAPLVFNDKKFWITYEGGDGNDVELIAPSSSIAGRHIFYNNSKFDGNTPGVSTSDDDAIATDKAALLPGDTVGFANMTSYSRGINGIMVDVTGARPDIGVEDFYFQIGDNADADDPSSWSTAPAPTVVSVRAGAGVAGSDRVEILWADGAITDKWLRVNVLSTFHTGLAAVDVFFFANKIGETGDISGNYFVTGLADELAARDNTAIGVPVTNVYDFNRDGIVGLSDQLIARNNVGFLQFVETEIAPTFQMLSGPQKWTPGQSVTLNASLPTGPDGSVDETVTDVDFYQDVNGNGVFDSEDIFLAHGVADPYGGTWSGTFDPADLESGFKGVIAIVPNRITLIPGVPLVGNTSSTQSPIAPKSKFVFWIPPGYQINIATGLASPNMIEIIDTGTSGAAYASGGGSGYQVSFSMTASATAQAFAGGEAQVILTSSAAVHLNSLITPTASFNFFAGADATMATNYIIESDLPEGSPVTYVMNLISYAGGIGFIPAAPGTPEINGNGGTNAIFTNFVFTGRVGDLANPFGPINAGSIATIFGVTGPINVTAYGFIVLNAVASFSN